MRRAAVAVAAVAALVTTGCTHSPSHPAAQRSESPTPSSGVAQTTRLAVVSSRIDHLHAPGPPKIVSGDEVRFATGGSGSCQPIARSVSRRGDTLVLSVVAAQSSCTLDLVLYVVVAKFNRRVFDDPTLRYIKFGYLGQGKRVLLTRGA